MQLVASSHAGGGGQYGLLVVLACLVAGLATLVLNRHFTILALRKAERSFRDLYDNINEGVFRSTLDGRMISANPALVRLNGFATEAEMLRSVNDIAKKWYVDPNRRAEIHEMLLETGRVRNIVSEVYRYHTRERIWIEESTRLVRDARTGEPIYYDGTIREVTEAARRRELQDRYEKITSVIPGCLYQHRLRPDGSSAIPYASIGLTHILGLRPEDVVEDAAIMLTLVHPEDRERLMESFAHSMRTLTPRQCEYRVRTPDGIDKWVFGHSVPEREADGSTLWHGYLVDVSERKRSEARIYDLAYFDPLTGLPNRTTLVDQLRRALVESERSCRWGAILFIDLDQFKILNDTKGHHVGDRLLCELAGRLRRHVGEEGIVARLGGDEFVVMVQDLHLERGPAAELIEAVGRGILSAIDRPFLLDGHPFQTTASIGVALFQGNDHDLDDLLKRADVAMYEAKAAGRGSVRLFEPVMQAMLEERLTLTTELKEALEHDRLMLVYQPQVDDDGRWIGAEALLRWRHPERGEMLPGEFLPLAERSGLIGMVDQFVLRTAAATLRRWQEHPATRDLQLAVNIGAPHLTEIGFIEMVEGALASAEAPPSRLTLELTEHVMLDDADEVSAAMLRLKQIGVKFALDDFGTGYSSLSYLKRLPINTLKIDQSFIRDLEGDTNDRVIVQTILNIARSFRVSVIAEGVENQMQALLLRQLGCHLYQGYLFARPMPLEVFEARLGDAAGAFAVAEQLTA